MTSTFDSLDTSMTEGGTTSLFYDTVVVGAGPGGIAAVEELNRRAPSMKVALIELGRDLNGRHCPVDIGRACNGCGGICNVISGVGGSIHYGDGVKLSKYPSGRRLGQIVSEDKAHALSDRAFQFLSAHMDDEPTLRGDQLPDTMELAFGSRGLAIRPYPVATIAESALTSVLDRLRARLDEHVDLFLRMQLTALTRTSQGFMLTGHRGARPFTFTTDRLVLATGRAGLVDTQRFLSDLGVKTLPPSPSIGVRFEMRKDLLDAAGTHHPDLKITQSGGKKTKSFCFCGGSNGGRIKFTNYQASIGGQELITLDGHETLDRVPELGKELSSNFGLLCQLATEGSAHDPHFQATVFDNYRRISGGRPIVSSLRAFNERTPDDASWAELKETLPFTPSVNDLVTGPVHRLLDAEQHDAIVRGFKELMAPILEMSETGVTVEDIAAEVIVVGLEVEFMWDRVEVDAGFQTSVSNLHVVGDAAGVAQGVIQAMMTGMAAGEAIASDYLDSSVIV